MSLPYYAQNMYSDCSNSCSFLHPAVPSPAGGTSKIRGSVPQKQGTEPRISYHRNFSNQARLYFHVLHKLNEHHRYLGPGHGGLGNQCADAHTGEDALVHSPAQDLHRPVTDAGGIHIAVQVPAGAGASRGPPKHGGQLLPGDGAVGGLRLRHR